jgi:hypothetical protein
VESTEKKKMKEAAITAHVVATPYNYSRSCSATATTSSPAPPAPSLPLHSLPVVGHGGFVEAQTSFDQFGQESLKSGGRGVHPHLHLLPNTTTAVAACTAAMTNPTRKRRAKKNMQQPQPKKENRKQATENRKTETSK